jgi:hypothetical protein
LILSRLRSGGNFSVRLQLFDFIEHAAADVTDREIQARFALHRLRSMSDVASAVPFGQGNVEPYSPWLHAHDGAVVYNEPAGAWMVDPSHVQAVHEQHRQSVAADDVAWFYVTNGLYGECEGDVPCYVRWIHDLDGWYLRSHPNGRHADESNADVAYRLNGAMDNLQRFPRVLAEFDPKTRCSELHKSLDPLAAAVTASTSARKAEALAAIDRYAKLCN